MILPSSFSSLLGIGDWRPALQICTLRRYSLRTSCRCLVPVERGALGEEGRETLPKFLFCCLALQPSIACLSTKESVLAHIVSAVHRVGLV
jgi:hypothetical protein